MCARGGPIARACEATQLLGKMIGIMELWYRQGYELLPTDYNIMITQPLPDPSMLADRSKFLKLLPIIHKKGAGLFAQFRCILSHKDVARVAGRDHTLVPRMLRLLSLFDGLQPQKREANAHIPYETDYAKPFGVLGDLAQAVRGFGECFVGADPQVLQMAISHTAEQIRQNEQLETTVHEEEFFPRPTFGGGMGILHRHNAFTFPPDVMLYIEKAEKIGGAFSFHNHTHYLLGWLIKAMAATIDFGADGQLSFPELLIQCFVAMGPHAGRAELDHHRMQLLLINQPLSSTSLQALLETKLIHRIRYA